MYTIGPIKYRSPVIVITLINAVVFFSCLAKIKMYENPYDDFALPTISHFNLNISGRILVTAVIKDVSRRQPFHPLTDSNLALICL